MDDIPIGLLLALLVLLIFLSAFFSGSETATTSLNRYRLADQANKKNRKAILLQKLIKDPESLLGTILLGNNLVNNAIVAIATLLAWQFYGEAGVALSTGVVTVIILVFAEIPPKTYAAVYPERIAYFAVYLLKVIQTILFPLVWLVSAAAKFLELIVPIDNNRSSTDSLNTDQLKVAVEKSATDISEDQRDLLLGVLDLGSYSVESALVPHQKILAIDIDDEIQDIVEQIKRSPYSRLPVYDKSFKDFLGELEIQKILQNYDLKEITKERIVESLRKPIYVPEDSNLLDQIQRLHTMNRHMGIVIDEYGEIMGIVTLHDFLEEMAGILRQQSKAGGEDGILREEQGSFLVNARMHIRDLNHILNLDLPTGEIHTLNGLILEQNEDIPPQGTTILLNGYPVETVRVSRTEVKTARINQRPKEFDINNDEH